MKRLAAVVAATVLASGCGFHDDDCTGAVTVEWIDGFVAADGAIIDCGGVEGPDFVDIFVDGQPVDQRFICSDGGATIVGLRRGTHVFTVEGVQASSFTDLGQIINRHEFEVDARCGEAVVRVQPAAGVANLNYSTDFVGCNPSDPPNCFLWFSVFDVIANRVTAAVTKLSLAADQDDFPYPLDVEFALPAGPHTVQWMELVGAGTFTPLATKCTATPFTVAGGALTEPAIALAAGGPACH